MLDKRTGIVTFAFGRPAEVRSNKRLAEITSAEAVRYKLPVLTQEDIAIRKDLDIKVKKVPESNEGPPSTIKIAWEAVKWAESKELERLLVVAAKPHLPRCLRDLQAIIKEEGQSIKVKVHPEIKASQEKVWFFPESSQPHTRSIQRWRFRELILMSMPFSLYKKITF